MNKQAIMMNVMLCLMLLLNIGKASAQTLVLHHADDTTTDVELYTRPQVKFQNDKIIITSTVLNMEYPKEDVLRFTYKGSSTGITVPNTKADYSQEDGQLVFHGIKSAEKIAVYTTNGIRVPINISHNGDNATLTLKSIPSGIYLLDVNGKTSKFVKP